jgi:hypothetical protein
LAQFWELYSIAALGATCDLPQGAILEGRSSFHDGDGMRVPGRVTESDSEMMWAYNPREPWEPGEYFLLVHPTIEDLAGNQLDRLFDETENTEPKDAAEAPARLRFRIR